MTFTCSALRDARSPHQLLIVFVPGATLAVLVPDAALRPRLLDQLQQHRPVRFLHRYLKRRPAVGRKLARALRSGRRRSRRSAGGKHGRGALLVLRERERARPDRAVRRSMSTMNNTKASTGVSSAALAQRFTKAAVWRARGWPSSSLTRAASPPAARSAPAPACRRCPRRRCIAPDLSLERDAREEQARHQQARDRHQHDAAPMAVPRGASVRSGRARSNPHTPHPSRMPFASRAPASAQPAAALSARISACASKPTTRP